MEDLRYPIGKYEGQGDLRQWIDEIAAAPSQLRAAVKGLSAEQLDTPYRPGGWTVRQLVHHVPDSHLNAYVRCRMALTEDEPLVKTYEEGQWAELPDARSGEVEPSLNLLGALHQRWVALWRTLGEAG